MPLHFTSLPSQRNDPPLSDDAVVWRYMDIPKFLSLLTSGELWFTRVSEFWKTDPFEGAYTPFDEKLITEVAAVTTKEQLKALFQEYDLKDALYLMELDGDRSLEWHQLHFIAPRPSTGSVAYTNYISCWYNDLDESDAMWSIYARHNAGIAIKSTVGRIKLAFQHSEKEIAIARVSYANDQNRVSAREWHAFAPILAKRHFFRHEHEIRLIYHTLDGYEIEPGPDGDRRYQVDPNLAVQKGYGLKCDLQSLIECVVASPGMEPHNEEALRKVTSMLLPGLKISRSKMRGSDFSVQMSPQLEILWKNYLKTKLMQDFDQIQNGNQPTNV